MDIPRYSQMHRSSVVLPEICVQDPSSSARSRLSNRSISYAGRLSSSPASIPMPIPNAPEVGPPPPLPPPKYVDVDPVAGRGARGSDVGWHWSNSRDEKGWGRSASMDSRSNMYRNYAGSGGDIFGECQPSDRRSSSTSTVKNVPGADARHETYSRIDYGYSHLAGATFGGSNMLKHEDAISSRGGFQSSVHDKFKSNAQAYDRGLLDKLDSGRNSGTSTPPRPLRPPFTSSLTDSLIRPTYHQREPQPLSLPVTAARLGSLESPSSRWPDVNSNEISPKQQLPTRTRYLDYRHDDSGDRSPSESGSRGMNGSVISSLEDAYIFSSNSHRGSYDQYQYPDTDVDSTTEETNGLKRLHIDDSMRRIDLRSPQSAAGQKRRASSPPRDGGHVLHSTSSANDLYRRRESLSRTSSARVHSNHGSVSSTTSNPRQGSYASTMSLAASSISTMSSHGRHSPGGISPGAISPRTLDAIDTPSSRNISPRSSFSRPTTQHTISEPRSAPTQRKPTDHPPPSKAPTSKVSSGYVCECCPKKPKKFDTETELLHHEAEKQYQCAYCSNRFKNKNEAERHQKSLHLRKHSWSCASLKHYASAFHPSAPHGAEADVCGFCGLEFPRTGPGGPEGRMIADHDLPARYQHVNEIHKFGDCNQAKKFFRADHFRQHLKHSHAGTSGKWTNMLENSCMKDEVVPDMLPPLRVSVSSQGGSRPDRINEEDESP